MKKAIAFSVIGILLIGAGVGGTLLKIRQHQKVEAGYQAAEYISALIKLGALPDAKAVQQALDKQATASAKPASTSTK